MLTLYWTQDGMVRMVWDAITAEHTEDIPLYPPPKIKCQISKIREKRQLAKMVIWLG